MGLNKIEVNFSPRSVSEAAVQGCWSDGPWCWESGSSCLVPSLFHSEKRGSHSCVYLTIQHGCSISSQHFCVPACGKEKTQEGGQASSRASPAVLHRPLLCVLGPMLVQSRRLFGTPWLVAHKSPLSVGFSGQGHWTGVPCPPRGIFLTQRLSSCLLCLLHWQGGFFLPLAPSGKPLSLHFLDQMLDLWLHLAGWCFYFGKPWGWIANIQSFYFLRERERKLGNSPQMPDLCFFSIKWVKQFPNISVTARLMCQISMKLASKETTSPNELKQ